MPTIDLNCDLGEDPAMLGRDIALLEFVTSANIACGGHAGDEATMRALVRAALARGRGIGAHPSYPDRAGFGRVEVAMAADDLAAALLHQISTLAGIARDEGASLAHVKPHGALYHAALSRPEIANAIASACMRVDPSLAIVAQALPPGAPDETAAAYHNAGLRILREAFADRAYEPDGRLRSRSLPGALITDPVIAAAQAVSIARDRRIIAAGGTAIPIDAQTICIHSDTPGALETARAVAAALRGAGITPAPRARNNAP